jgi:hypothetical protein
MHRSNHHDLGISPTATHQSSRTHDGNRTARSSVHSLMNALTRSLSTWPRFMLAAGVATALLFAACADEDTVSTSTPDVTTPATTAAGPLTEIATVTGGGTDPSEIKGPPALTASGGGVEGPLGVGTYCWSETAPGASGPAGVCADAIGIITTPQVFAVSAGTTFEVTGFGASQPTSGTALVWPNSIASQAVGAFARAWTPEGDSVATLDVGVEGDAVSFVADLEPGAYVVGLSLQFPDGDVQYGLVIEVQ